MGARSPCSSDSGAEVPVLDTPAHSQPMSFGSNGLDPQRQGVLQRRRSSPTRQAQRPARGAGCSPIPPEPTECSPPTQKENCGEGRGCSWILSPGPTVLSSFLVPGTENQATLSQTPGPAWRLSESPRSSTGTGCGRGRGRNSHCSCRLPSIPGEALTRARSPWGFSAWAPASFRRLEGCFPWH